MRDLSALLSSDEGRRFLELRKVFTAPAEFESALRPPVRDAMQGTIGEGAAPVYAGHQAQIDHSASVVAKFRVLAELSQRGSAAPMLVWLDTDRIGSQTSITTIVWAGRAEHMRLRLAPHRLRNLEARHIELDAARVTEAFDVLASWVAELGGSGSRVERLREAVAGESPGTLAALNVAVSEHVLGEHLALRAPRRLVSQLCAERWFIEEVAQVIRHLDDVVSVVNAAIEELHAADVDPVLHSLDETYLPLHVACARDGARIRLRRAREAGDEVAVGTCRCGEAYRFVLTNGGFEELAATGRWSVDVLLPLFLDAAVAGVVAGRSSALYGLVLNQVVTKVFAREPAPMIVPEGVGSWASQDSLLCEYLVPS